MSGICPVDKSTCTLDTCSLKLCGQVEFLPNVVGNVLYGSLFGLLLLSQIGLGIGFRTWSFLMGMSCGLVLEILGYVGRIMLHNNPFEFNNFILYLIPLTIAPAFMTGAIYLCLSRIVIIHGEYISRLRPRTYSIVFMSCDIVSLISQGAGGYLAATANTKKEGDLGRYIMLGGMIFQVLSAVVFMGLWLDFIMRLRTTLESKKNKRFIAIRTSQKFKWFTVALWTATVLIFTRSVYRIAELQEGFHGAIANNETVFMIFEGPMILLAVFVLTVLHPGFAFGGKWTLATGSFKGQNQAPSLGEYEMIVPKTSV